MLSDTGGVEATVHAATDLQDENAASRQPTHLQATRRSQVRTSSFLAAGVPPQEPTAATVGRTLHQRRPRAGTGLQDPRGVNEQCRSGRAHRGGSDFGRRADIRRQLSFTKTMTSSPLRPI